MPDIIREPCPYSICRKNRIYAFGKRKYEEEKCFFVEGKENNFVLKKAKENKTKSDCKKVVKIQK